MKKVDVHKTGDKSLSVSSLYVCYNGSLECEVGRRMVSRILCSFDSLMNNKLHAFSFEKKNNNNFDFYSPSIKDIHKIDCYH